MPIKYSTFAKSLQPKAGQQVAFQRGKGYYVRPAVPRFGTQMPGSVMPKTKWKAPDPWAYGPPDPTQPLNQGLEDPYAPAPTTPPPATTPPPGPAAPPT